MTFALDRTRSFLKIEEPNLLSLHRSTHPVVPSAEYCRGHSCDAIICVVNEYNLHRVYLALHDQQMKSNLVFISDPVRPDAEKIAVLVREARSFLEGIGFAMDVVDINFSTAIREVIIKDIRVMREPTPALQLDAAKAALEVLAAEKEEILLNASRQQMALAAELEELRKRLSEVPSVQPASAGERSAAPESCADSARQSVPDAVHTQADEERIRLVRAEKELQEVREELAGAEELLKSAVMGVKQAKEEARQARKEHKQHKHENETLQEQLKAGRAELEKARKDIEALRHELHAAGKSSASALEEKAACYAAAEAAHQAEAADLKAEIHRLETELAGKSITYSGETEVLRVALAEAHASLAVEKAKNESALLEMDALERNASVELKQLKKKVDTLTAEKQLLEKIAVDIKNKARGEIERQQQINQAQRTSAIKKVHALQEEIRQLAEARAVIASPTGMPPVPSGEKFTPPAADGRDESVVVSHQTGFAADPFASCEAGEYINFLPDTLLKGIPYSCSTDIVEVFRSYNTIHAAPSGKQAQRCDGFVCLITESGQYRVYVAWLMNVSGETLVCLPEREVEGEESCRRTLYEGIGYFERIGFVIDRVPLEVDPDKRRMQLDGLAVFCCTVPDHAA